MEPIMKSYSFYLSLLASYSMISSKCRHDGIGEGNRHPYPPKNHMQTV